MSEDKRKRALYLPDELLRRFEIVFLRVKDRNGGRAEFSAVVRELMGFPVEEGKRPLVIEEDREIIRSGSLRLEGQHGPTERKAAPTDSSVIEAKREAKKKRFGN
jgi:hypothetical protein